MKRDYFSVIRSLGTSLLCLHGRVLAALRCDELDDTNIQLSGFPFSSQQHSWGGTKKKYTVAGGLCVLNLHPAVHKGQGLHTDSYKSGTSK